MRLVLRYTITDDCTYSDEIFVPFEFSSKEEAAKILEDGWKRWKKDVDKEDSWREKMPSAKAKRDLWDKWNQSRPGVINPIIKLGTVELEAQYCSKIIRTGKERTMVFDLPRIQTLDEWFDSERQ